MHGAGKIGQREVRRDQGIQQPSCKRGRESSSLLRHRSGLCMWTWDLEGLRSEPVTSLLDGDPMVRGQVFEVLNHPAGPTDCGTKRSGMLPKAKEEFLCVLCRET